MDKFDPRTQGALCDLRLCATNIIHTLCGQYHSYGSCNNTLTYSFAVYEQERVVAVFGWNPPPFGAAQSVCFEAPSVVLALVRMCAVPKTERRLKHISKPLRTQMKKLIDRVRWPVLITYSDEGQGHTGYVYKCSGMVATKRTVAKTYTVDGNRVSRMSNSFLNGTATQGKSTYIQRWETWSCEKDQVVNHINQKYKQVETNKVWRSGNKGKTWVLKDV